jgi:hypothetical protein
LPVLYDWLMRSKIMRMYGELRFLEDQIVNGRRADRDMGPIVAQIDQLEQRANVLKIPAAYASMLYMLRNHIDQVRERLQNPPAT